MPSQTTNFISPGDVDFYFTQVNKSYLRALEGQNRALYTKIAFIPQAGQFEVGSQTRVDGNGFQFKGTKCKFPVSLASNLPGKWPYRTSRPREQFSQWDFEVFLERWCPPSKFEAWTIWNNDLFGLIQAQLPQMMDRSIIHWDYVLALKIVANEVGTLGGRSGYDSLPFFTSTANRHEANPVKPGVANFFNDVAIPGINEVTVRELISQINDAPGPDGLPLDTDTVKLVFLCPNVNMQAQINREIHGTMVGTAIGTAGAGVSNALMGINVLAETVLFKLLLRAGTPVSTITGKPMDPRKVGYLLAVPNDEGRPFAVIPSQQPTAYYTGLNSSDALRAQSGEVEFGWEAFGEALLTIPQRALRFTLP